MEFTTYDVYAMQLLRFFIVEHGYQVVRIQQHKDDIWLMNAKQEQYPVLRISSKASAGTIKDSEYIKSVHRIILNLIHREGPIMIFNTNPDAVSITNPLMSQVKVGEHSVSDPAMLKVFPGLDEIIHTVENEQSEFIELSKEIEEVQLHMQKENMIKAKKATLPKTTFTFIAINAFIFIGTLLMSMLTKSAILGVISSGGYYKMNVVAAHEYFRLFTAGFIHGDIFQLLIHLYIFYQVGKVCERMFTRRQYCGIYLLSMLIGNVFVFLGAGNVLSFGMSGAVLGIVSAYLTTLIANGSWRLPMVRVSMIKISWYAILMLLVSGLAIVGMLGSLITGVFLAILFHQGKRFKEVRQHVKIAGGMLLVGLAYFCIQPQYVQPIEKEVDSSIVDIYQNTPMNAYAEYLKTCYDKQYEKEQ